MQKMRLCLVTVIASVAASAATLASAAGLGSGGSGAVLGQPLDFVVQVRLDPGEALGPECVAAEVMAGQRRLPASQVTTRIERQGGGSARIRVVTTLAMDEPVIAVELDVGCQVRMARNYIVLADPPDTMPVATRPMAAVPAFVAAPADADALAAGGTRAAPGSAAAAAGTAKAASLAPAPAAAAAVEPPKPSAPKPPPAVSPPPPRPERRARAPQPAPPKRPPASTAAVAEPPARLRLDFVEPVPDASAAAVELAIEAVALAASAARAQAAAASATAARIAYLERNIARLTSEIQASRAEAGELREQVSRGSGSERWMLPLLLLLMLLSALTAWLAWRLSSVQRDRQHGWREALAPEPEREAAEPAMSRQATSPIPFVTSEIKMPSSAGAPARARGTPAWPAAAPAEAPVPRQPATTKPAAARDDDPATQRTEPLVPPSRLDGTTARDVSIEELIDLEQQAEFFVVLGQDEAAVDLLQQHLRDTGGGSPLPYLKLLEIHYRRGDRSAYERMRERFNHCFNAYAPAWGADLQAGRSLEDYAGVLPRLQQVWARPLDAMAELEALLFRKSRGELFELSAYREVLFLYALARDLHDRDAVNPHHVDLLLPLADGGEFSSTAPSPFSAIDGADTARLETLAEGATSALDLDISHSVPPTSIFDRLDESAPPPRV